MIPSDHFVRFYNEVFKFLDERDGLRDYYDEVSHEQARASARLFWGKGLKGYKEHYDRVYHEENCLSEWTTSESFCHTKMLKCPSLSKVTDNDAGPCEKYCLHCPGWELPLLTRCGLYCVYDMMGLHNPQCQEFVCERREDAEAFMEKHIAEGADPKMIRTNLDEAEVVEAYRQRRLRGEPMPKELFE